MTIAASFIIFPINFLNYLVSFRTLSLFLPNFIFTSVISFGAAVSKRGSERLALINVRPLAWAQEGFARDIPIDLKKGGIRVGAWTKRI